MMKNQRNLTEFGFPDYWEMFPIRYKNTERGNMAKIGKEEYEPTESLKASELKKDIETSISELKEVQTRYGKKRVATLKTEEQIFLNVISLKNLVDAFGEEMDDWIGKDITVTSETSDRTQNKASIVIVPKK